MVLPPLHHDSREVLLCVRVTARMFVRMHGRHTHVVDFFTELLDLLGWLSQTFVAHHIDWHDEFRALEALVHKVLVVSRFLV